MIAPRLRSRGDLRCARGVSRSSPQKACNRAGPNATSAAIGTTSTPIAATPIASMLPSTDSTAARVVDRADAGVAPAGVVRPAVALRPAAAGRPAGEREIVAVVILRRYEAAARTASSAGLNLIRLQDDVLREAAAVGWAVVAASLA